MRSYWVAFLDVCKSDLRSFSKIEFRKILLNIFIQLMIILSISSGKHGMDEIIEKKYINLTDEYIPCLERFPTASICQNNYLFKMSMQCKIYMCGLSSVFSGSLNTSSNFPFHFNENDNLSRMLACNRCAPLLKENIRHYCN